MNEDLDPIILQRFVIHKKMGKGAYGVVWWVTDKISKKTVALKKVFEAFHNSTDAQRTYWEIMILSKIKN